VRLGNHNGPITPFPPAPGPGPAPGPTPGPTPSGKPHWALLIAGSNTWGNYRHQADIAHAYQVLKKAGVPTDKIVTFMYDDIANSPNNPHPGKIINNPQAEDVYAGINIDYKGEDVTAVNFLAALAGNKQALQGVGSGKVVDSGADDEVFVYFADHGGPGILGMPQGQPYLYAKDLVSTLQAKAANNGFKQLTFYVEACESGSIFDGLLPANLNIYVVTAANPNESSWGYYCPGMTPAPPAEYDTCLGDLFSIAFLEDCDVSNLKTETLDAQYTSVKNRTSNGGTYSQGSHVMQYGTTTWTSEHVAVFLGVEDVPSAEKSAATKPTKFEGVHEAVAQADADMLHMWTKYTRAQEGSKEKLAAWEVFHGEVNQRNTIKAAIKEVTARVIMASNSLETVEQVMTAVPPAGEPVTTDWECYKQSVSAFEAQCGLLPQSVMKQFRAFANMCNRGHLATAVSLHAAAVCPTMGLAA
jgi:legumain